MAELKVSAKFTGSANIDVENLSRRLERAGRAMVSSTQRKINSMTTPANAPLTATLKGAEKSAKPLRDTGALQASITSRVDGHSVHVGTSRTGARINNFGGVIRPRKGKWLLIPATRQIRKELESFGGSPARLLESRRKSAYIMWRGHMVWAVEKGRWTRLFILRKSVVIPARPFLYIDDTDMAVLRRVFSGFAEKDS